VFARRTPPPGSGLHECRICHDDYVVPVSFEAIDDERWQRLLRCAQCETYRDVVVNNDVAEVYERDLERTVGQIADALLSLERARMAVEADVLATALARDLIDADDFVPR
jgi:hypothetical protein